MKKFIYTISFLLITAIAYAQNTVTVPSGAQSTGASSFLYTGTPTDSLAKRIFLRFPTIGSTNEIYTATYINSLFARKSTSLLGANQGLTDSAGTVQLGGIFHKNSTIDIHGYSFELTDYLTNNSDFFVDTTGLYQTFTDPLTRITANINIGSGSADLVVGNGNGYQTFQIDTISGAFFNDDKFYRGIRYHQNYDLNADSLTLMPKKYIDSLHGLNKSTTDSLSGVVLHLAGSGQTVSQAVTFTNGITTNAQITANSSSFYSMYANKAIYSTTQLGAPWFSSPYYEVLAGGQGVAFDNSYNGAGTWHILQNNNADYANSHLLFTSPGGDGIVMAHDSLLDSHGNLFLKKGQAVDSTGQSFGAKKTFGAVGNAKISYNGSTIASNTTLVCSDCNFSIIDVGKTIGIPYAGADTLSQGIGNTFQTSIASVTNSTTVVLSAAPIKIIVASRIITDAAMTINSNILTSATASWTKQDIGKKVIIPGAGEYRVLTSSGPGAVLTADSLLTCYIIGYTNSTTVILSEKALNTISARTLTIPGATVIWGTDDSQALQNLINYSVFYGKKAVIEQGRYLVIHQLLVHSNLDLSGFGYGNTILQPLSPNGATGFSLFWGQQGTNSDSTYYKLSFRDIEMDGIGVTTNNYTSYNKAFYIRPATNLLIDHCYVHDFSATGIGTDFLQNYVVSNNVVIHNGRQFFEFSQFGTMYGGCGIGIGTGLNSVEQGLVSGNVLINNGNHGIYFETQNSTLQTKGIKVIGNSIKWSGNAAMADYGNDGAEFSDNSGSYNTYAIEGGSPGYLSTPNYTKNGQYFNNAFKNNFNALLIQTQQGGQTIRGNTFTVDTLLGTNGIKIVLHSGTFANDVTLQNNYVRGYAAKGISIEPADGSAKYGNVNIDHNQIYNTGTAGVNAPGINLNSPISTLSVQDNASFDLRATGFKTQTYGLSITAGTVANLYIGGNIFTGNITGTQSITGVTNTFTRPTYSTAGTWSADQTFNNILFNANATYNVGSNTNNALTVYTNNINSNAAFTSTSASTINFNATNSNSINFEYAGTAIAKFASTTGNFLIGGTTDNNYKESIESSGSAGYFQAGNFNINTSGTPITPLIIGGTTVTSALNLQGTNANGTTTSPAINFLVGNNGATNAMTVLNNGFFGIGTTAPTHQLTIAKASNDIPTAWYYTSDQITNYGRFVLEDPTVSGNGLWMLTPQGGGTLSSSLPGFEVNISSASDLRLQGGSGNSNASVMSVSGNNAGTINHYGLNFTFNVNSGTVASGISTGTNFFLNNTTGTGTSGYKVGWFQVYDGGTGSGTKMVLDAGTNSANTGLLANYTSKFSVDINGLMYFNGTAGTNGQVPVSNGTTMGWINLNTGLITGTPTIVAGTGAGTSPTVSVTTNGKQLQVTVTTGTLPTGTNATIATVTLPNALSYTPLPVFSSASAATALLNGASMIYMTSTGTANVTITSGTTALTAATTYVWNVVL